MKRLFLLLTVCASVALTAGCAVVAQVANPLFYGGKNHGLALFQEGKFEEVISFEKGPEGHFASPGLEILQEKECTAYWTNPKPDLNLGLNTRCVGYLSSYNSYGTALVETGKLVEGETILNRGLLVAGRIENQFRGTNNSSVVKFLKEHRRIATRTKAYLAWFIRENKEEAQRLLDQSKQIDKSEMGQIRARDYQKLFDYKILGKYEKALEENREIMRMSANLGILDIDVKYYQQMAGHDTNIRLLVKIGDLEGAKNELDEIDKMGSETAWVIGKKLLGSFDSFGGGLAIVDISAGAAAAVLRDFPRAAKYFDRAAKYVEKIDPSSTLVYDLNAAGSYYIYYGAYYLGLQGQYRDALKVMERGLSFLRPYYLYSVYNDLDVETAHLLMAELYLLLGRNGKENGEQSAYDLEAANKHAIAGLEFAKRYHNRLAMGNLEIVLGEVARTKADSKGARAHYDRAKFLLKDEKSTENWKLFYGLGVLDEVEKKESAALGNYIKAVNEVENLWAGRLKDASKQVSFIDDRLVVFEPVIRIYARQGKAEEALGFMERAKSRAFFESSVFNAAQKPVVEGEPLKAAQVRALLDPGTALLEYYVGRDCVVGAVVRDKSVKVQLLDVSAKVLTNAVMYFRNSLATPDSYYVGQSAQLYQWLVAPFKKQLEGAERVGIVPHGVLHYLPFSALVIPESNMPEVPAELMNRQRALAARAGAEGVFNTRGVTVVRKNTAPPGNDTLAQLRKINGEIDQLTLRSGARPPAFLVSQWAFFYAPSATVLARTRERRLTGDHLLVLGSPPDQNLGGYIDGLDVLSKLPGMEREARRVAAIYPGAELFLDREASETRFKERAGTSDLVVLSAHGMMDRRDPMQSSVFLQGDKSNDGRVSVAEIENMNLKAAVVVLSACETGLVSGYGGVSGGEDEGKGRKGRAAEQVDPAIIAVKFPYGDDMVGLQRAFIRAGAGSVISTLWQVSDDSSEFLVTRFFSGYKDKGGRARALSKAQRDWLEEKAAKRDEWGNPLTHPFYWAAHILSGAWD